MMQGLRQEVKDIVSQPSQPEDPEQSHDPDSEEDPDIAVELIDGLFHQLNKDNILVAITADYPGLIPASQVMETRVFHSLNRDSVLTYFGISFTSFRGDSQEGKPKPQRLANVEPPDRVG